MGAVRTYRVADKRGIRIDKLRLRELLPLVEAKASGKAGIPFSEGP